MAARKYLQNGALDDLIKTPLLLEFLYRYISNQQEIEVIRAALSLGKDGSLLTSFMEKVAPWMTRHDQAAELENILMSDDVQKMRIHFNPSGEKPRDLFDSKAL